MLINWVVGRTAGGNGLLDYSYFNPRVSVLWTHLTKCVGLGGRVIDDVCLKLITCSFKSLYDKLLPFNYQKDPHLIYVGV